MWTLALDSALARCAVAVLHGEMVIARRQETMERGQAARLSLLLDAVLLESKRQPVDLDLIAVTLGPGSFTGIRACLALALGLALGAGRPLVGVTVGEAIAESLPALSGRQLWVATDSRRGRVFLERPEGIASFPLDALPRPDGPVALAGDAAPAVAAWLAARDHDVMLTNARMPGPAHVAKAARRRQAGELPPRRAEPLYVDAPEVRLPAGGIRPPPRDA